ncbi:MAG: D-alanyl-D-alanine carboxypeptidase family protein [Aminipila sp.]
MNSNKNNKIKNSFKFKIKGTKLSVNIILISILCVGVVSLLILYPLIHNPAQNISTAAYPTISAKQAVLMDATTGKILYERNSSSKAYPASTTKIMTALLTIETVEELDSDLTQKVKIPAEAVGVEGSSIYLSPGEAVSIEDLLYGLMLRSGNDAATALAIIIGGNQDNFVNMMNARAKEIGCTNTHFLNPSGLFDENHYTTTADMALIAQTAMQNKTFKKISAAETWEASRAPDKYNYFYNKNKVVHQYQGGNGIKIGFTKASGRTLVASAERNGKQLICVVMGAPDWFNDSYKLMDYGFSLK